MIDRAIGKKVLIERLTYLSQQKISSLFDCIDSVMVADVPGDFMEFGVALGGSGICLASALDDGRRYLGFDVFGMIPAPSGADGDDVKKRYEVIAGGEAIGVGGDRYYGYVEQLIDVVKSNFLKFGVLVDGRGVNLVQGLFSETLPTYSDATIAIAHIDCDWYEPVMECLNFTWPRLSPGGYLIVDDYNDWTGCRRAVDDFVRSRGIEVLRYQPHVAIVKSLERRSGIAPHR